MLQDADISFLEDCIEDWRGLWEVAWMEPDVPIEQRAAFAERLVEQGLLDVLCIANWEEARASTSTPLARGDAVAVAAAPGNYVPPGEGRGSFHVLSVTAAGKKALADWYRAQSPDALV